MASYMGHEYTPAVQGRYRVGDRVCVVKDGNEDGGSLHQAKIGTVGVIRHNTSDGYLGRDDLWFFKPHEIEPAFRPGDRVKLNKHSGIRACGERGMVSEVRESAVRLRMDERSLFGALEEWLPIDVLDWERAEDVKAEQAKPEPKFKAGDVVRCLKDHTEFTKGKTYVVRKYPTVFGSLGVVEDDSGRNGNGWDAKYFELAPPCPQDNEQPWKFKSADGQFEVGSAGVTIRDHQPCIVALTKNGQPLPSHRPHVHASVADATEEAERLARINPGQEFAVYQRVAGRVAEQHFTMKEVA